MESDWKKKLRWLRDNRYCEYGEQEVLSPHSFRVVGESIDICDEFWGFVRHEYLNGSLIDTKVVEYGERAEAGIGEFATDVESPDYR